LNGTHHLLAYADDVNLLGDSIDTIRKDTETLIVASKEVTSPTSGGRSVGIVRSRTQTMEFSLVYGGWSRNERGES
jgi:hypothetical protein